PWRVEDQFLVLMVKEVVPAEFGLSHMPASADQFNEKMYKECSAVTGEAIARLKAKLPDNLVESKVCSGQIAPEICFCARQRKADMIVMGSNGRQGVQKFLLGSVAEEVLKKAPCSVEIIKSRAVGREKLKEAISQ
ncbi:MAG: universal stress protein, partial [Candidatus Obscuribacterales bacterium]|nr:universal stress protein [Candidatus Obscuribacterales bacterium]